MGQSLSNNGVKSRTHSYVPDLDEMLSQCELNYFLIQQLIPELQTLTLNKNNEWELDAKNIQLKFVVTDVAKYTVTMKLYIQTPKISLLKNSQLIVRLYHDAKMMEVMEGSGPSALKAIITQSASECVDEKRQINRFIGECLHACHKERLVELTSVAKKS